VLLPARTISSSLPFSAATVSARAPAVRDSSQVHQPVRRDEPQPLIMQMAHIAAILLATGSPLRVYEHLGTAHQLCAPAGSASSFPQWFLNRNCTQPAQEGGTRYTALSRQSFTM
jgi:hypothetical protein